MAGRGERLVRDWGQADERRLRGRRSRVVLTSRRWCQVCGGEVGPTGRGPAIFVGDGDKKARSPGRARNRLLKPLRAGMLGVSGKPVVTTLVCLLPFSAREAAGALGARHSPRPHLGGRETHNSGASRRGNAGAYLK